MDLRKKTLVNLTLAIIIITIITIVFSSAIILKNYEKLESGQISEDVNLVVNNINAELSGLKILADTWGISDGACAFVKDEYPEFIEKNFPKDVYSAYDINALIFTNSRGDILYSQGYDYDTKELEPVPPELIKELASGQSPFRPPNAGDSISGFFTISKGPAFIVSSPVRSSNFSSFTGGRVIIGKYIYGDEIEKYRLETVPSLTILSLDSPSVPPETRALLAESGNFSVLVRPEGSGGVAGYKIIRDVYGNDAVLLRIEKPRDIYNQGLDTVFDFILILITTGLFFGILVYFLINKDILSRIRDMNDEFGKIGSSGNISTRIRIAGNDELSHLGKVANQMLEQIEITRHALMETEIRQAGERKYKDLIEFSPQIVIETDTSGTFKFFNRAGLESTGYTQEDIDKGLNVLQVIVPEDHTSASNNIQKILAGENPGAMEYTAIRKDGTRFPVIVYADRIVRNKVPSGIRVIVVDITDRKRAEEELRESEQKYHDIIDNATDLIQSVTPEGKIIFVNRAWKQKLGYSETDIPHLSLKDIIHPDSLSHWMIAFKHLLSGEDTGIIETVFISKDGKKIAVEGNVSCRFINGEPAYTRGIFRDVTERNRAKEETELLASVIRYSRELVNLATPSGMMIFLNDAGKKMLGISDEDVTKTNIAQVIPGHFQEKLHQEVLPAILGTGYWEGDIQYLNLKTGGLTNVHAITYPINDPKTGAIQLLANVSTDITERKLFEDTLLRVNRKLNILSRLTREDLTNQIFILGSYLGIAKKQAAGQDQIIETVQKGVRAIRLINETIDYSKDYQDMGAKPPKWQNVKVAMLFGLSHISIGNIRHSLETEDLEIFADPLLEKVCQRLFENSVKHGDHVTRIRVWHMVTPDGVTIVFEDDGTGIPPEKKEQIFLRGDSMHVSTRSLNFVREILDITGITIKETGEPGKGARFDMTVPKGAWRNAGNGA